MPTSLNKEALNTAHRFHHLARVNPFTPERIALEKEIIGSSYKIMPTPWNLDSAPKQKDPNILALASIAQTTYDALTQRGEKSPLTTADFQAVRSLTYWIWFHNNLQAIDEWIEKSHAGRIGTSLSKLYLDFHDFFQHFLTTFKPKKTEQADSPEHIFASLFQIRRAFYHTFRFFIGSSVAAMNTRRLIWESLFTFDIDRFFQTLYKTANQTVTLITGPSGSGKEVIAQAIGQSQFIPFDSKTKTFAEDFTQTYLPINLAALSPTLLESELFGHTKGSFTGAATDRVGYFEACGRHGAVFLDEIGEINLETQVKLLRVLQAREFYRIGETKRRPFKGKCIAATNRHLPEAVQKGTFREDLFYRLQSDCITAPSLRQCIQNNPDELKRLTFNITSRLTQIDEGSLHQRIFDSLLPHINDEWNGNFRELEQAVRQVIIRGNYSPFQNFGGGAPTEMLYYDPSLTLEQMISNIVAAAHQKHRTLQQVASALNIDPRTVKKYLSLKDPSSSTLGYSKPTHILNR